MTELKQLYLHKVKKMQPHPDWNAIENFMVSVPEFVPLSSLATIYYDETKATSYAQQNGCVVLNETTDTSTIYRLIYLVLHELQHIGLLHFERGKKLNVFESPRTSKIFNIAADILVDMSIRRIGGKYLHNKIINEAERHFFSLEAGLQSINENIDISILLNQSKSLTTEKLYHYLLDMLKDSEEFGVLTIDTGDVQDGKDDTIPITVRFPDVNNFNANGNLEASEYLAMKKILLAGQAWNSIYSYFKVTTGRTKVIEGHLSQRMMLNRSVGGLRLMSRKHRVDGTHRSQHSSKHSDAILFMDVSGSIERDQVDALVAGIANQLQQNNLKGATLVTYNTRVVDVVTINRPSDISGAKLRIGGGTNINRTLNTFKQDYSNVLEAAKVAVIITDGDDDPITQDIGIPILSVVFTPLNSYSKQFLAESLGTVLHLPELI